jgi:hypothetical protein
MKNRNLNTSKTGMLLFTCFLFITLSSCEKALLGGDPGAGPVEVFDALWEDVDERYSFFREKGIDWDSIGSVYRAQLSDQMEDLELFDLLAEMLFALEDGHVNLTSTFDLSRNWEWYLNYPPNFNETILERNYLGNDYRQIGPFRTQLLDSVLYAYYGSFSFVIEEAHLDELMSRANKAKGLILDIRDNGGGSLSNARRIASCLTSQSRLYARRRIKTGPGHEDFSPWEDQYISPREGIRYTGKVAVLTNRSSYSASNFFAQMARVIPNAVLIGDRSGGGGGVPAYGELPNGWTYRFSSTQSISPDGEQLEFGIPVDIEAALEPEDEVEGVDSIIERAREWLN